jgi:hypothetical protein
MWPSVLYFVPCVVRGRKFPNNSIVVLKPYRQRQCVPSTRGFSYARVQNVVTEKETESVYKMYFCHLFPVRVYLITVPQR